MNSSAILFFIIGLLVVQRLRAECEDTLSDRKCAKQLAKGNCDLDHIKVQCQKTCGACVTTTEGYPSTDPPTTTVEPTTTEEPTTTAEPTTTEAPSTTEAEECKDSLSTESCEAIKDSCDNEFAATKCMETCGKCATTTTEAAETTAAPEVCCSTGQLETHADLNWHGDVCRAGDGSWTCPGVCEYSSGNPGVETAPYCVGADNSPCRVEAGEDCNASVCPDDHPILDPYPNLDWHGDVCRDGNGGWTCPEGCEYSSGNPSLPGVAPYCVDEGTISPCRT